MIDTSQLALPKPGLRPKSQDGELWCDYHGAFHAKSEFSTKGSKSWQQSCRAGRNESLRVKRRLARKPKKCAQCGKEFTGWMRQKFCSVACERTASTQRRWNWRRLGNHESRCLQCDQGFTKTKPWQAFCSKGCKANARNQRRWPKRQTKVELRCKQCGDTFFARVSDVRRGTGKLKFCTPSCWYTFNSHREGPNSRGREWSQIAKRIRVADGLRCVACEYRQKGYALPVDHIVPYRLAKRYGFPNADANLIAVCRSCHASKTGFELKLFRGDVVGFIQSVKALNYPMERVMAALRLYGLVEASALLKA